jgi:hypothetical protein
MTLEERIKSFADLGEIMRNVLAGKPEKYSKSLNALINNQFIQNPWFTPENVRTALGSIANELTEKNLTTWTSTYPELNGNMKPLKAGVIMAGNIPLVGFHDLLSVLISGNNMIAKTSSKDSDLLVHLSDILCSINPKFNERIVFTAATLSDFDVVIATGSNNSSRYFEYYFGKYPNIIRKNRNSIAVLEGDESKRELEELAKDVFTYFGLGCRNISKIYLPAGYDLNLIGSTWKSFDSLTKHSKYANNYDFNKAVFIVNKDKFYDAGYLLLKEDKGIASPVSVLYYEFYESQTAVKQQIELLKENIQCVVGRNYISFGKAQSPHLWDYADGIDTLDFLLKKK